MIIAHYWQRPIVFDHDHPERLWELAEVTTPYHKGAALLDLQGPVLAVCDHHRVLLWDYPSRTEIAVLGGQDHNDIIEDMAELHVGPAGRRRLLPAVAHVDGVLRLWDGLRPEEPLALCIDIAGLVGETVARPAPPRPRAAKRPRSHPSPWTRIRTRMRRGRPV